MMNYALADLELYIKDLLKEQQPEKRSVLENKILTETEKIKVSLFDQVINCEHEVSIQAFYNLHMQRLVEISDAVYTNSSSFDRINAAILDLIYAFKRVLPGYLNRDTALPMAFRLEQSEKFKVAMEDIISLSRWGNSSEISKLIKMPFDAFGDLDRKMSWFHFVWLKRYMKSISTLMMGNADFQREVINLLIAMDFNSLEFFDYCKEEYQSKLQECGDRESLDFVLNLALKALSQLPHLSKEPFYPEKQDIREALKIWLEQEISFESTFDSSVLQKNGSPMRLNGMKLRYNLTVSSLSFWLKIQHDMGMFNEPDLKVFAEKSAYNFSSSGQNHLSAGSITAKFYPKEFKIISPVFEMVKKMIEELKALLMILEKMLTEMEPFLR